MISRPDSKRGLGAISRKAVMASLTSTDELGTIRVQYSRELGRS
nr:hypothetical protein pM02_c6_33 [uncultured bacterium]